MIVMIFWNFSLWHCFFSRHFFVGSTKSSFFCRFLFSLSNLSQRRQNIAPIFLSNRQTVQNFFVGFIFFCHFDKKNRWCGWHGRTQEFISGGASGDPRHKKNRGGGVRRKTKKNPKRVQKVKID